MEASRIARKVKHPFRNLLRRRNRPQLVVAVLLQIFQQLTGISAITFYAPVLFTTLGFKTDAALYSAVIIGAVNVLSTLVSVYAVDRAGRRMLLLEAGAYMFLSQAAFAVVFRIKVTDDADGIDRAWAVMVVAMAFLSMLCRLKYAIFAAFAVWDFVMSLFVLFFLPETKNVPIEEMTERVWKQHWFWKRFVVNDDGRGGNN
ncbi:unnamed protein product [Urochloa humidicola]